MAEAFTLTAQGYRARLTEEEIRLLARLFDDVALTLEPEGSEELDPLAMAVGINDQAQQPQDPALARLLPAASTDPDLAQEFRRYTDLSLRQTKRENLTRASMSLSSRLLLDQEGAQSWAAALNDVRLVLGTRLGIEDEQKAQELGQISDASQVESTEDYMALVYNFVSWLQESLMEALIQNLDSPADRQA